MLVPGSLIGKYVVRRKLAEGGMAELYLCSSRGPEGFEKDVVIKRIRPTLASDPQFVRMFIREACLASCLNHPNVVQIFDFDQCDDSYYLAMEYVRGRSLAEVRKRCKARMTTMPPTLVAHIGAQIARGLHYVHGLPQDCSGRGLVHRDVSPHNMLLSFDGAVKLTDFGIAQPSEKSAPGRLKGKLAYMSPEQSRGDVVDARTDVFALGIVLWEMMTGGRLFEGNGDAAVLQAVRTSVIPPAARVNPDVPLDIDAVVMKALQRPPEQRYQTAQELERALAHCVFKRAQNLEEIDVGAFLRRLFADEVESKEAPPSLDAWEPAAELRTGSPRAPPPKPPGNRSGWREPGRIALKLALGAVALVALVASPQLHSRPQEGGSRLPPSTPEGHARRPPPKPVEQVPNPARTSDLAAAASPAASEWPPDLPQTGDGTLVLKIAPWAFLSIDGRHRGEVSGIKRYRLPAGRHRLRLWHPRGSKEVEIQVGPGERRVEEYQVYSRWR